MKIPVQALDPCGRQIRHIRRERDAERRLVVKYLWEGVRISRDWASAHVLAFDSWPQNCHGAGGRVT